MNTRNSQITVADLIIDIVRKNIKNLHLAVYPPDGRVRIATPLQVSEESVRLFVLAKLPWIRKQQAKFAGQARQSQREYLNRESHYVSGLRYLLNIIEHPAPPRLELRNNGILDLYIRPGTSIAQRDSILNGWYRSRLKTVIPEIIAKYEPLMGVEVVQWGIKQMKTKWGACNIKAQRIWLNLELAKKPERCLEYVIVHEMTHLLERNHNDHFRSLLDEFMPDWRRIREELNEFVL